MAESSSISNPSQSRKRRKIDPDSHAPVRAETGATRWRTRSEQLIYSSKLVSALRRPEPAGASVRDAADRVLAVSAQGKTRWSRAILTNTNRLAHINKKHKKAAKPPPRKLRPKRLPPLQKKVEVLSRLVPGCRKLSLPNLLEETTGYIAALEMQVRAMSFLVGILNGGAAAAALVGGDQLFSLSS